MKLSIRRRLTGSFMLLVLVPAVVLSATWAVVSVSMARRQVIEQLESVATLKEAELNAWVTDLHGDLSMTLIGDETNTWLKAILSNETEPDVRYQAYERLHEKLGRLVEETDRFDELFVMNRDGHVVLSTDTWREGRFGAPGSLGYLQEGLKGKYVQPPSYNLSVGGIAVIAVAPIVGREGVAEGILAGRASPARLSQIMLERTGLGDTGETYLVTPSHIMLTEPRFPREQWLDYYFVFTQGATSALNGHESAAALYANYQGVPVVGVYHWMPELQVALLAERATAEAMRPIRETVYLSVGITALIVLLAAAISLTTTRHIVLPLEHLVRAARRITSGDLTEEATVERADEIGVLAQAFNTMTARLRDMVSSLEVRVEERTQALRRRAVQLETSTQVSREITSILDLEDLLWRVVELIREAFDYYHVGIFLVEDQENRLVFGAGNPTSPRLARARSEHLVIGSGSLNGQVAQTKQPLVVSDVFQDPRYLADESLPETRSELVVPLRMGDRVLGTLDVQSTQTDAFSREDVQILQSLGDQVAVAIENARLYDRSQILAVMEERNRLARELHDSVTQSLYSLILFAGASQEAWLAGDEKPTMHHVNRIEEVAQHALREMRLLIHELRPPGLKQAGLLGALERRLEMVERRVGIIGHLETEGTVDLPPYAEDAVYRVAQEALNNALRHASATMVSVRIRADNGRFALDVIDDGVGFAFSAVKHAGGMGLEGMRDRAEQLAGTLAVVSSPGQGTMVSLNFPLEDQGGDRQRAGEMSDG